MALAEYQQKRHFDRTPEPTGKAAKRRSDRPLRFVVQRHAARRLHYDFRLELDGVLLSWTIPKGPSVDSKQRRLAVHVEDHPLAYADFEGRIPPGEYGAGEVAIWDRGTWTPDGDPHAELNEGRLRFHLHGEKLTGGWMLLRLKDCRSKGKDNWLLMKRKDDAARDQSEINGSTPPGRRNRSKLRAFSPSAFRMQLATLSDVPPEGNQWLHEIKLDGYRMLAAIEDGKSQLITRNHLDWTKRYPTIAAATADLPVQSAVLDGELVALDDDGVSRFQLLQNAATKVNQHLVFYVFDLLHLNGKDLRTTSLVERKRLLRKAIPKSESSSVRYCDHLTGHGHDFLQACCQRGLEGIVSKRADRPYRTGRSDDWLKIKCVGREELVIGGYTNSAAARRPLGALLVGYFADGRFVYAGRVGTGFDASELEGLREVLRLLQTARSPFDRVPQRERTENVRWVRPQMVIQVQFGSWTNDGLLRHASFQGLREDKPASEVGRPESLPRKNSPKGSRVPKAPIDGDSHRSDGDRSASPSRHSAKKGGLVTLTHPERVVFPDTGLTKRELADYFASVAGAMLPHIAGRPLSLLRCPKGTGEHCFFQKHASAGTSDVLRRVPIRERDKVSEYLIVDDEAGLAALAQMSVLEIHPWGCQANRPENPDRLTFDLDPGPSVEWKYVVEAARRLREVLERLQLESFVKTSGGKGLHVVVPLAGQTSWSNCKQFARAIAEQLAEAEPRRYTAKMAKAIRRGRIFIDYLRNDRGATAVAPYSPRARAGAPISMPLAWSKLSARIRGDSFTVGTWRKGRRRLSDPWKGFFTLRQELPDHSMESK